MKKILWLLMIGGTSIAALQLGGRDSGGGDVRAPWEDSAWFAGFNDGVSVCFQRAPSFGLSDAEVSQTIESAYAIWSSYLLQKAGPSNATGVINVATSVKMRAQCQGDEDLTFYFGVSNPQVAAAIKDYTNPIAFSHRSGYVSYTWDSGFIWVGDAVKAQELIQADWSKSDLLLGTLVHEIGHVLGNGHWRGTIMREDIIDFLRTAATQAAEFRHLMMTSVDWDDDLLPSFVNFDFLGSGPSSSDFKKIVGRDPVGPIAARVWRKEGDFHYTLKDNRAAKDLILKNLMIASTVEREGVLFKIYDPSNEATVNSQSDKQALISLGSMTIADGTNATVMFQRGGGDSADTLVYVSKNGETNIIFEKLPGGIPRIPIQRRIK